MADDYSSFFGVPRPNAPADDSNNSANQSQLFHALMSQSMQGGQQYQGVGGVLARMLGAYAGQSGLNGLNHRTVDTGQAGDSLGQVSLPDSFWGA